MRFFLETLHLHILLSYFKIRKDGSTRKRTLIRETLQKSGVWQRSSIAVEQTKVNNGSGAEKSSLSVNLIGNKNAAKTVDDHNVRVSTANIGAGDGQFLFYFLFFHSSVHTFMECSKKRRASLLALHFYEFSHPLCSIFLSSLFSPPVRPRCYYYPTGILSSSLYTSPRAMALFLRDEEPRRFFC